MARPDFSEISSGKEFNSWYWLKEELVEICKQAQLPTPNGCIVYEKADTLLS